MGLIIFVSGCISLIAIVLVFLLNLSFPTRKFVKYLPTIFLLIAGILLLLVSYLTGSWTGLGLLGMMAIILGVVILLIAIIIDMSSKK